MGGLFGGGGGMHTEESRIGALRVQTSAYGGVVPLVYGTQRIAGNLLWYGDFVATPHTTTQSSGGKGGGQESTNTTYTYSASIALALCCGPIRDVLAVWKDKSKISGSVTLPETISLSEVVTIPPDGIVSVKNTVGFLHQKVTFFGNAAAGLPEGIEWIRVDHSDNLQSMQYSVSADGTYVFYVGNAGIEIVIHYSYSCPSEYKSAASNAGFTLFKGTIGQPTWSYLTSSHPEAAVPYSGLAYVAASGFNLNSNAAIENHTFEIRTPFSLSETILDANPGDVLTDFLTNANTGAGFPASSLGDLTQYLNYVAAAGLFFSPALLEQEDAQAIITRWMQATNSEVVWSEGKLKVVPYGDEPISGHGVNYTPNLTPLYDLNDDDFLADDEAPIKVKRSTSADAYNQVQVEYLDRANEYNTAVAEATDQANIDLFGLRPMSPVTLHEICDSDVARHVAQLILQRALYIRNTYEFRLGWRHCLLEPMDLVTISDVNLGLNKMPVRIVEIEEDDTGQLSVVAEDWPFGTAGATRYAHQYSDAFSLDMNAPAGPCATPVIFETSPRLSGGRQQLMIAVAGTSPIWGGADVWLSLDGTGYKRIGRITGPARYGKTTAAYKLGGTPDRTGKLPIDLSVSGAVLAGGTQSDADALATLCWIDGELIAYRDAKLTATGKYELSYIVRGCYDTPIMDHAVGTPFVRLDDALFQWEYPDSLIGHQVSIKLTSINAFGGGGEDLASVDAWQYTLMGKNKAATGGGAGGGSASTSNDANTTISYDTAGNVIISFNRIDDPTIKQWEIRAGDDFEGGTVLSTLNASSDDNFFVLPLTAVIGKKLWIKALYTSGTYSTTTYSCSFACEVLPAITGVNSRIVEPAIEFSWSRVLGADHYVCYWEEGGVTTVRVVTATQVPFRIPKYASLLRIYAVNTSGGVSQPYDQHVALSGTYNLNEIVNIPLAMTSGQYINLAFTSSNQVEKVSLLGPSSFTTPISSPNNAGCYTFGYNLQNTAGSALQNTPGSWFRKNFWYDKNGFYESVPVDLCQVLSGRLKLSLTKTVTAYGSGAGSAFAHVLGEYMAEATGLDLTDTKAFLSAQFYVSDTLAGPWVSANDGDWVTACRYVKIIVKAEHVSPLTDCLVTAGALTLDVPDMVESGTKSGVTSAGTVVTLAKSNWHAISLVLLTPKGNAKAWATNVTVTSGTAQFTINTDVASVDVGYFVKGY